MPPKRQIGKAEIDRRHTHCISHLLQTLYVDPGPQILAVAHELFQSYRLIRSDSNNYNHKTIEDILAETKRLMDMVAEIRQQLARGTLVEPEALSPASSTRAGKWVLSALTRRDSSPVVLLPFRYR